MFRQSIDKMTIACGLTEPGAGWPQSEVRLIQVVASSPRAQLSTRMHHLNMLLPEPWLAGGVHYGDGQRNSSVISSCLV